MSEPGKIRKFIYAVILLNLITLVVVFAWPRTQFVMKNGLLTPGQISETSGSLDLPNQFATAYQTANSIKKLTPQTASIVFISEHLAPPDRSAAIQVLYPRRIQWINKDEIERKAEMFGPSQKVFLVFRSIDPHPVCGDISVVKTGSSPVSMCEMKRN